MPWAFDDDVLAVCSRGPRLLHPAKSWLTLPLQVIVVGAVIIAVVRFTRPDPIPVHKSGPDRPSVTTVAR